MGKLEDKVRFWAPFVGAALTAITGLIHEVNRPKRIVLDPVVVEAPEVTTEVAAPEVPLYQQDPDPAHPVQLYWDMRIDDWRNFAPEDEKVLFDDEHPSLLIADLDEREIIAGYDIDTPRQLASKVKVYVGVAYLSQHGAISDMEHNVERRYGRTRTLTEREIFELMINESDNYATNHLMEDLGGPQEVERILKGIDPCFEDLRIVEYIPMERGREGRTYLNKDTFRGGLCLWDMIWNGEISGSNEFLEILSGDHADRIVSAANAGALAVYVANKTGTTAMYYGGFGIASMEDSEGNIRTFYIASGVETESRITPVVFEIYSHRPEMRRITGDLLRGGYEFLLGADLPNLELSRKDRRGNVVAQDR